MGSFMEEKFAKEFACRTKLNYYNAMKRNSTDINTIAKIDEKIDDLQKYMSANSYIVNNFYEVTMLINSIIGLLIFPLQEYYDNIGKDKKLNDTEFPILSKYIKDKTRFENTYKDLYSNNSPYINQYSDEKNTPRNIINHLRNAVAHDRIMIRPMNAKHVEGNKENIITDVIFEDVADYEYRKSGDNHSWNKKPVKRKEGQDLGIVKEKQAHFYLMLKVEDLEGVLMEICDYILK